MEALNFNKGPKDSNGATQYNYHDKDELPKRPGYCNAGKAIIVRVNQFKVTHWPSSDIQQYDVHIGASDIKPGKVKAIYHSPTFQGFIRRFCKNANDWLWDGNKIAWSSTRIPEQNFGVCLDRDYNKPPRRDGRAPETTQVVIRPTATIRMAVLQAYLNRQMSFDSNVLCAINFLDHAMRQWPSEQYTQIKRSFFSRGPNTFALDNTIVAMKGVYSSIRLCDPKSSTGGSSTGLAVNVDVANGTFWTAQDLHQAARNYCKDRNRSLQYQTFINLLRPVKYGGGGNQYTQSEDFKALRKFAKVKFTVKHRTGVKDGKGIKEEDKLYTIKRFTFDATKGADGSHAKNTFFPRRDPLPNDPDHMKNQSVYDYFYEHYGIRLTYWQLPLVQTETSGMFPMELCCIAPNQRYPYKLDPNQTASMIKFAVTRPKQRIESIQHGIGMLKWDQDPYLTHFGIKIDKNLTTTQARVLQPPDVQFANGKKSPGTSGRWDLRGMKFIGKNRPLVSWAIVVVDSCTSEDTVHNWVNLFVKTYTVDHGGLVTNKNPKIFRSPANTSPPNIVAHVRQETGGTYKMQPQIIFYILPGRDSATYERMKKSNECRFGVVSQMLNVAHINKPNGQYCSNVAMKVHAKLGGTVCQVGKPVEHKQPTLWIGADVSHASPGSQQASMAAMTMSTDLKGIRFAAHVETNGRRVEMIQPENVAKFFRKHLPFWSKDLNQNKPPAHIFYFRDGVSEGQYIHVLDTEVDEMQRTINKIYNLGESNKTKFTVVICTKRHHIRIFPKDNDGQAADRNQNPVPGVLVEKDVTHPYEYDFYLNAHSAIQGTARPVHYVVLRDDIKMPVNLFQQMIYENSYQYQRSTTPVSLFPAIYYAHLASNRARAHDFAPSSEGARGGQKFEEARQDQAVQAAADRQRGIAPSTVGSSTVLEEVAPLTQLGNNNDMNPKLSDVEMKNLHMGMWYI